MGEKMEFLEKVAIILKRTLISTLVFKIKKRRIIALENGALKSKWPVQIRYIRTL
ncbi:hypothetical protein IV64_GL002776 [Lactiplantibacillus xiangfangensis]|jgi:hypothetical protein|uniref:Uncharacterized protein n=1 Tax=Lactiplantibacillus xiangfangensis TaxID=942150 RepID=A0A0R2MBD8_9LACO|nr:hypothetical protein IV64_GL002776 [Lactiplantibacillus xiangfangensis]